jgi:hypothetical protein
MLYPLKGNVYSKETSEMTNMMPDLNKTTIGYE